MTGHLVMPQNAIDANRPLWHQLRAEGLGASEFAVMLGLAPRSHGNPYSLWVAKRTGKHHVQDADELARGRVLEPYVAGQLAEMRPDLALLPGGLYRHPDHPWMMATFDRFAINMSQIDEGQRSVLATPSALTLFGHLATPVEIKTAHEGAAHHEEWGEEGSALVPMQYRCQALVQMAIWGAQEVIIPVQFMLGWRTAIYVIKRDADAEGDIKWMIERGEEFMRRVRDNEPPEIDWSKETAVALRTLNPLEPETLHRVSATKAKRLKRAYLRKKAAEEAYGLVANQLSAEAKGAHRIVVVDPDNDQRDITVLTRSESNPKRVSVKLLRERYPDIAEECEVQADEPESRFISGRKWMKS